MNKRIGPVHPGEVLLCEFLQPHGISQTRLAKEIGVSARGVNEICLTRRGISADMALRLSIFFGTSPEFWMTLQNDYDMRIAKMNAESSLRKIIHPFAKAS